jgi:hypothetical protein
LMRLKNFGYCLSIIYSGFYISCDVPDQHGFSPAWPELVSIQLDFKLAESYQFGMVVW